MKRKRSDRNETRMKQTVTKMKQLQPLPSYPLRFHCFLTASFLWLPRPSREGNSRASVSTLHSSVPVTVSGGQEEGDMSRKTLEAPVNPIQRSLHIARLGAGLEGRLSHAHGWSLCSLSSFASTSQPFQPQ